MLEQRIAELEKEKDELERDLARIETEHGALVIANDKKSLDALHQERKANSRRLCEVNSGLETARKELIAERKQERDAQEELRQLRVMELIDERRALALRFDEHLKGFESLINQFNDNQWLLQEAGGWHMNASGRFARAVRGAVFALCPQFTKMLKFERPPTLSRKPLEQSVTREAA